MNSFLTVAAHAHGHEHNHTGHNHGFFGEWIEHLLEHVNMNEKLRELLGHIIVDTLHIFFLLLVVMFAVYLLTSYINMDKLHKKLGSLKSIWGFLLATFIGVLSPFCSCSIIPVLMGFLSVGVPVSVCLCFLTASSMINLTAILSLYATTGTTFTLTYIICSLIIITISSIVFSLMKLDNSVSNYHSHHHDSDNKPVTFKEHLTSSLSCTFDVFKRSFLFIIIGVVLSSVIMTYLSIDHLTEMVNNNSFLSATIVSLIGIPVHSDIFSIAPILLLLKTISPNVAMTFTLATMAISLPSVIILTRAIKTKTVLVYCGVICALTILIGYATILVL